jgi:O-antigen ligase
MTFGLFFVWSFAASWRVADPKRRREDLLVGTLFLGMVWWLFSLAGSATSLACAVIGTLMIVLISARLVSRRFIGVQIVAAVVAFGALESTVGIYDRTVQALGRDPTLTDRTELWRDLFAVDINPVLGAGFESFWLGQRREDLWAKWWWKPTQAHNGYIETYLNLGWLGVFLLGGVTIATFRKGRAALLRDVNEGRLRLAFLFAILAYNYTESSFKGVHLVWTMFHLMAIDYRVGAAVPPVHARPLPSRAGKAPRSSSRAPGALSRRPAPHVAGVPAARARRPLTKDSHP